ncbi:MAG: hypothetical protein OXG44_10500 [Gammaproteobacteria bacterium]|nr:hypothetical protein [Gammaproteobacteria bacterium]
MSFIKLVNADWESLTRGAFSSVKNHEDWTTRHVRTTEITEIDEGFRPVLPYSSNKYIPVLRLHVGQDQGRYDVVAGEEVTDRTKAKRTLTADKVALQICQIEEDATKPIIELVCSCVDDEEEGS